MRRSFRFDAAGFKGCEHIGHRGSFRYVSVSLSARDHVMHHALAGVGEIGKAKAVQGLIDSSNHCRYRRALMYCNDVL